MTGDSKRTYDRGPFLVGGGGGGIRAGTGDFCSALAALVGPVQNVCFLTIHYFNAFVPLPSKLGRKPYWVACLLVCVSGYKTIKDFFALPDVRPANLFAPLAKTHLNQSKIALITMKL